MRLRLKDPSAALYHSCRPASSHTASSSTAGRVALCSCGARPPTISGAPTCPSTARYVGYRQPLPSASAASLRNGLCCELATGSVRSALLSRRHSRNGQIRTPVLQSDVDRYAVRVVICVTLCLGIHLFSLDMNITHLKLTTRLPVVTPPGRHPVLLLRHPQVCHALGVARLLLHAGAAVHLHSRGAAFDIYGPFSVLPPCVPRPAPFRSHLR